MTQADAIGMLVALGLAIIALSFFAHVAHGIANDEQKKVLKRIAWGMTIFGAVCQLPLYLNLFTIAIFGA